MAKVIYTTHSKAPDMLLDVIAEVGGILAKSKESENKKFWLRVFGVMKYAYGYMNDLNFMLRENEILKAENEFMKHWTRELSERLNRYEVITEEKLSGTFDETVNKVDKFING